MWSECVYLMIVIQFYVAFFCNKEIIIIVKIPFVKLIKKTQLLGLYQTSELMS